MTRFYNLFTRSRSCLVGFAVFCFLSVPVCAKADLTQAEIEAAVYNVLMEFARKSASQETIVTLPMDGYGSPLNAWLRVNNGISPDNSFAKQWNSYIRRIGSSSNDIARAVSLLSGLSGLGDMTNGWGYATADTLHQQMDMLEYYLQGIWGSSTQVDFRYDNHGNELLVAAPDLEDSLDDIITRLYAIETMIYDSNRDVGINISSNLYEMGDTIVQGEADYWNEDPETTISDAQDDVDDSDDDAEDFLEDTFEHYEYDVPDLDELSEPHTDTPTDSSGVGDISLNVQHSALITLTQGNASHTPSSPFLPAMEIDLATTPGAANFISDLSTLIRFGWDAIFAFLGFCLYYSTFRRIRNMLIATRAGGVPPGEPFSLHYDPF